MEKRKFAERLRGVGTAATIRENVVKDLRENSVLVRMIAYTWLAVHPSGLLAKDWAEIFVILV